ncbi:SRPBCC family protein [Dokdonella sp.]|uniref:SRPBCC family protein n=1 Tax=Dokdonella sp. TaxID=2291710 RepID=UPI002F4043DB
MAANEAGPTPPASTVSRRPHPGWMFGAGALYGLFTRLLFVLPFYRERGGSSGVMLASFVLLVPMLIGALTVYLLPPVQRTIGRALFAPLVPVLAFVGGTAILLIEGSICIALALPIFLFAAMLGGLLGWLLLLAVSPSRSTVGAVLALPLLLGAVERDAPLPDYRGQAHASVFIAAPAETIWHLINDARGIQPDEMAQGIAWRIGVPFPQEAVTVDTPEGRVRKLRWDKGVHFDEPILDWVENRYIRWRYVFAADSIPPAALDEHVLVGGRHFDLVDTSYRLTPEQGGTRLAIDVNYRVSTHFNAYAGAWADLLVGDAARTILAFYQRRAEAAVAPR